MKRKRKISSNTTDKDQNKKQKTTQSTNEAIIQIVERRQLELVEIVSKENELFKASKKKAIDNKSCQTSYPNSETNSDVNSEENQNYEQFKVKEGLRTLKSLPVIAKKQVLQALNILENDFKKSKKKPSDEEKRLQYLKVRCNIHEHPEHTWDSVMYIVKNIRTCILTQDWNNLTHLLLLLIKHDKLYIPFAKQVTLLNFMRNSSDYNGEILDKFYKLCMLPDAR